MKKIVLQYAHETEMNGFTMEIEDDGVKTVIVPMTCGCQAIFAPTGHRESDRAVWKQVDMKFKEYSA